MDIRALLTKPGCRWQAKTGATEAQLRILAAVFTIAPPPSFLDLLRFSNGGEGDLALPPLVFKLDSVDEILRSLSDPFLLDQFPNFVFFGGNGGLERIAFDLRGGGSSWPIVMIDPIAGPSSAEVIAPSIDSFIDAMGVEAADPNKGSEEVGA